MSVEKLLAAFSLYLVGKEFIKMLRPLFMGHDPKTKAELLLVSMQMMLNVLLLSYIVYINWGIRECLPIAFAVSAIGMILFHLIAFVWELFKFVFNSRAAHIEIPLRSEDISEE